MLVERILKLIQERDIRAIQFANEAGLPKNAVSEWKNGKAKPSTDAIIKIAKYFGVSTDYLLTGKELVNQPHIQLNQNQKENIFMDEKIIFCLTPINERLVALRKEISSKRGRNLKIEDVNIELQNKLNTMGFEPDKRKNRNHNYDEGKEREEFWSNEISDGYFNADMFTKTDWYIWFQALGSIFEYDFGRDYHLYGFGADRNWTPKTQPEILQTAVSARITTKMRDKKFGSGELAKKMNIDEISVISWMTGERFPHIHFWRLLNGYLELGLDWEKIYESVLSEKNKFAPPLDEAANH
ncbi:MAG: helix-turn-helix transcriptional regulator [Defluviitaleaceae bacterium]|nr:helix-turn-helix transcriptional regulator [Defluviitaleaceae bacterium]